MVPDKETFSGCLIGQCLGDALGSPVEGFPRSECRQYIEVIKKTEGKKEENE